MDIYRSDNEQQHEAPLRRFFVNSKVIVIGAVIAGSLLALAGWSYWDHKHTAAMMMASKAWQPMNGSFISPPQLEAAQHFSEHNKNNYGALTSMGLARLFAERGNFVAAEKQLRKAFRQTRDVNLQVLINLRVARVQLHQRNIDGALKTLDGVKETGWKMLAEDIRGDALVLKGDDQAARAAYKKALQSNALQALVRMKLNNLSSGEGHHAIE